MNATPILSTAIVMWVFVVLAIIYVFWWRWQVIKEIVEREASIAKNNLRNAQILYDCRCENELLKERIRWLENNCTGIPENTNKDTNEN